MSQPKLLYRITAKQASMIATIAIIGMIAMVAAFFLIPDFASNSYAIDDPNAAMVDDQHYVSLSVSNADLSFMPAAGSLADSKQVGATVSTNVPGGAKLYLSTADDTNALYKDGDTSSAAIQPTSDNTTLANMPTNTWGYSLDNTNFQAVPTSDSAALIANVDGSSTGATSGGVTSATIPVYYGAKVDSSLPAGTYTNRVVYSAIGTIAINISSVTVSVDGEAVDNLQVGNDNTIVVTTDLMTSELGTPRVYYATTNPSGTTECGNVSVAKNSQGYMTITCTATPSVAATGVTLHITQGSSGDWKWGDFTVDLPNIVTSQHAMSEISTMQEMTPEFCASVTMESPGNTARLQDTRDGKYYWVAKLADGNCWMTQNLELDLKSGQLLEPQTSNVSSNWDPHSTTYTSASRGEDNDAAIQSWNLGKVVWKTPNSTSYCGETDLWGEGGVANFSDSSCSAYWQNVSSGWAPMTEYRSDGITYDAATKTYDSHYLAGNFYSFAAVSASGLGSICPKGFELPISGDFDNLANAYQIAAGDAVKMVAAPLFLVRPGTVGTLYSNLSDAGNRGYYRYNGGYTWRLFPSNFFSYSYDSDSDGFSVRCVAAG